MASVTLENENKISDSSALENTPEVKPSILDQKVDPSTLNAKRETQENTRRENENTPQKKEKTSINKPNKKITRRNLTKKLEEKEIGTLTSSTSALSIENSRASSDSDNSEKSKNDPKSENTKNDAKSEKPPKNNLNSSGLSRSMKLIKDENVAFVSLDVEQWERNIRLVTEIGITTYFPSSHIIPKMRVAHFIVKEYINCRNGHFVSDNKNNFAYGKSEILPTQGCTNTINRVLRSLSDKNKKIVFVGHNVSGDIKALKSIGVRFPKNYDVSDTESLWRETRPSAPGSLEALLQIFKVPYSFLHNAGNDAYLTLILLLKICDENVRKDMFLDEPPTEEEIANYPRRNGKKAPYTLPSKDTFKDLIM